MMHNQRDNFGLGQVVFDKGNQTAYGVFPRQNRLILDGQMLVQKSFHYPLIGINRSIRRLPIIKPGNDLSSPVLMVGTGDDYQFWILLRKTGEKVRDQVTGH